MRIINLTDKQHQTLIDNEDFELVSQYKWHWKQTQSVLSGYARTGTNKLTQKNIYMHRLIMNAQEGEEVDHINGNGLDNRRSNLRICTHQINQQNMHLKKISMTSQFRGVSLNPTSKKWLAYIWINGKNKYLGTFLVEQEASNAYEISRKKYFKEGD